MVNTAIRITLDKLRNRRCLAERLNELDLRIWQNRENCDHPMLGQRQRGGNFRAEGGAVDFCRLFGISDGDSHVIEPT